MSAPYDLHLDRRSVPGRVLLRATSSVNNYGSGPIELRARRARGPHMRVWQVIYDSRQRAHLFATRGRLDLKRVSGYRYDEPGVGTAYYWKFHNAAAFEVWSLDAQMKATALVRTGPKLDYCLRDLFRTLPSGASPEHRIYPGCNQDPGARRDRLGTSAGWSDVYPYGYPEQWVDVTGLRGRFAFVHIADPRHLLNESKPNDNISETLVSLPSGRVFGHRVGLARP
ncbi:MAG: hypothetical protein E6G56_10455 [Actinobacteria bacterium]|nr:MAG: hypothetical protein E6G56_10455 [Actinomycetota bacterium]